MIKRNHRRCLERVWVITAMVFLFATAVSAKDWHELYDMSGTQLGERISELEEELNRTPSDYEAIKGLGIAYHVKATLDAKRYAPEAVRFLSKAYEINNEDYETMCYLGSATTMMAKCTWNPMKKMSYVNQGAALMDKAVIMAPNNVSVRMTRANNSKNLPRFLERGHLALKDYEYLATLINKDPDTLEHIRQEVYSNLAERYSREEDF